MVLLRRKKTPKTHTKKKNKIVNEIDQNTWLKIVFSALGKKSLRLQ